MTRWLIAACALLLTGIVCLAQVPTTGAGKSGPASGVNPFSIDGTPTNASASGTSPITTTLTTTYGSDLIFIAAAINSGPITSISDNSGVTGTWTKAGQYATTDTELWYAVASAPFSGTISVTTNTFVGFQSVTAFAVSGANTGSPFDGSAVTGASYPQLISTSNANDMILGVARHGGDQNTTAGTGFTLINGANYLNTQYKIVTTTQTNLSVGDSGNSDVLGAVVIAVQKHP